MPLFSNRLPWSTAENLLAQTEAHARASGRPLIDLTVSNPTQVGLAYPVDDISRALADARALVYQPTPRGLPSAREAVARDYARRGATVSADQILLTASSSESYALLFKLLGDPGQVVLCPEPSYPLFEYLSRLESLAPRPYRLVYDGRWRVDFSSLDFASVAALVLVSPNNPTGSFVCREDLHQLAELAAAHDVAIIADEVFADFPLAPAPDAVPAVAAQPEAALTFSLGGLSKSCALPQMKLGWLAATGPTALVEAALARLELVADTYLSVGTPVQVALPALLQAGASVRRDIMARVQRNRAALAARLGPDSPCTLLPIEAGWCAILRVPAVMTDEAWACTLMTDDGVLVQPGYFFDLHMGATLVLSLIAPPADFDAGVARILDRILDRVARQ
jgi:aspartate/methionine/tyrosine aminotransferase